MDKCRETFEKLPEIVEILSSGYYYFLESSNEYNSDVEGVSTDTIDLAWCLYQKQQKQVNELQEQVDELTSIATELAEYASYAEIVGGVTVNRAAVRSFCDKVFDFNRKSDDQYIEQALKGGES